MLLGIQNYPSNASILLWQTRFCQAETGLLGVTPSTKWIASEWPVQEKVGFSQRLAQERDVGRQAAFLHEAVEPDCLQQLVLGDDISLGFPTSGTNQPLSIAKRDVR